MFNVIPYSAKRAAYRARWLAEISDALDQASAISLQLPRSGASSEETNKLRTRIAALRSEVDSIRKGRRADYDEVEPIWTG